VADLEQQLVALRQKTAAEQDQVELEMMAFQTALDDAQSTLKSTVEELELAKSLGGEDPVGRAHELQQRVDQLEQAVTRLSQQKERVAQQNEALLEAHASAKLADEQEHRTLVKRLQELSAMFAVTSEMMQRTAERSDAATAARDELVSKCAAMATKHDRTVAALRAQVPDGDVERDALEAALADSQRTVAAAKVERVELLRRLTPTEQEDPNARLADQSRALGDATAKLRGLDAEIASTRAEVEALAADHARQEAAMAAMAATVQRLEQRTAELEQQLRDETTAAAALLMPAADSARRTRALAEAECQMEAVESARVLGGNEQTAVVARLEHQIVLLKAGRAADGQRNRAEGELAELSTDLAELQAMIGAQAAELRCSHCPARAGKRTHAAQVKALKTELDQLRGDQNALAAEKDRVGARADRLAAHANELQTELDQRISPEEADGLNKQLADCMQALATVRSELVPLRINLAALRTASGS
jgi:chromosome segregation ATPase